MRNSTKVSLNKGLLNEQLDSSNLNKGLLNKQLYRNESE